MMQDEHAGVSTAASEAKGQQEATELLKPRSRSLFQPIKRLVQLAYMMRVIRVNISLRLSHVDFLM